MDNATNATQTCQKKIDSETTKYFKTLAYCLVITVAVLGNGLILVILYTTKNMRITINYFVANMAASDLLLTASVYPRLITEVFWGRQRWLVGGSLGSALCKLDYLFVDTSLAVSIQSLVIIAVERFNAVLFPLRPFPGSTKARLIVILCTWVIAGALHFPYLMAFRTQDSPDGVLCVKDWEGAFGASSTLRTYYLSMFVILAVIPFCLMVALYSAIVFTLTSLTNRMIHGSGESLSSREIQFRVQRERSVLAMAIATVVGFALCWAPMNVCAFLMFFVGAPSVGCGELFYFIAFFLAYSNCAVNPCLCFAFSKKYRTALKSVSYWPWRNDHRRIQPEVNGRQPGGEIALANVEGRDHRCCGARQNIS